jgi:hypothetical protein
VSCLAWDSCSRRIPPSGHAEAYANICLVTTSTGPWAIVAAIAIAISAAVVAWQAVETRRSLPHARKRSELAEISTQAARAAIGTWEEILRRARSRALMKEYRESL